MPTNLEIMSELEAKAKALYVENYEMAVADPEVERCLIGRPLGSLGFYGLVDAEPGFSRPELHIDVGQHYVSHPASQGTNQKELLKEARTEELSRTVDGMTVGTNPSKVKALDSETFGGKVVDANDCITAETRWNAKRLLLPMGVAMDQFLTASNQWLVPTYRVSHQDELTGNESRQFVRAYLDKLYLRSAWHTKVLDPTLKPWLWEGKPQEYREVRLKYIAATQRLAAKMTRACTLLDDGYLHSAPGKIAYLL